MGNIAHLPAGGTWSVATAADAFVDALDNPNTVRGYGTALNAIVDRVGADRPLALAADDEIDEALELAWGKAGVNTWNTRRTAGAAPTHGARAARAPIRGRSASEARRRPGPSGPDEAAKQAARNRAERTVAWCGWSRWAKYPRTGVRSGVTRHPPLPYGLDL
ncbi:hypothetical protein ACFZBU_35610 [Embleya sp. NPDC008237]|uniref:hypothetical protein n=1 Tax=Embleya sp. NPDC008237 TaxID=3363978 RepID=UPI0036E0E534